MRSTSAEKHMFNMDAHYGPKFAIRWAYRAILYCASMPKEGKSRYIFDALHPSGQNEFVLSLQRYWPGLLGELLQILTLDFMGSERLIHSAPA